MEKSASLHFLPLLLLHIDTNVELSSERRRKLKILSGFGVSSASDGGGEEEKDGREEKGSLEMVMSKDGYTRVREFYRLSRKT